MPPTYVALAATLMSAALVYLLVDRRRHWGRWSEQREEARQALQELASQVGVLRHEVERRRQRVRELEALVLSLSARLEGKSLEDEDRRLLSDVYHEYGTEGHEFYFGHLGRGDLGEGRGSACAN